MRQIKVLKDKKSPIRVSQHLPDELREKRKLFMKLKNIAHSVILRQRRKKPNLSLQKFICI